MTAAASVFAIVVAIEQYESGIPQLPGLSGDAVLISTGLARLGVPPENILVFVSPMAHRPAGLADEIVVRQASLDQIPRFLKRELPNRNEEFLFVFWGGHGVRNARHDWRLIYADAAANELRNLSLNDLKQYLRSSHLGKTAFRHQLFVVDACSEIFETRLSSTTFPDHLIAGESRPLKDVPSQAVLASSSPGEKAQHRAPDAPSGPGIAPKASSDFTQVVYEALQKETVWPPDVHQIAYDIKKIFSDDAARGRQTPNLFYEDAKLGGFWQGGNHKASLSGLLSWQWAACSQLTALPFFQDDRQREEFLRTLPASLVVAADGSASGDAAALVVQCGVDFDRCALLLVFLAERDAEAAAKLAQTLDRYLPTDTISWHECASLMATARANGWPGDEQARAAFGAFTGTCGGHYQLTSALVEGFTDGQAFATCVYFLAQQLPVGTALFKYLELCSPAMPADAPKFLKDWQKQLKDRLRRDGKKIIVAMPGPGLDANATLVIRFSPKEEPGDPETSRATAWWIPQGSPDRRRQVLEQPAVTREQWDETLATALRSALPFNSGMNLRIEVILPLAHFETAVDACLVPRGRIPAPLGTTYPVLVRPYERLYHPHYLTANDAWRRKWMLAGGPPPDPDQRMLEVDYPAMFRDELFTQMLGPTIALRASTLDAPHSDNDELQGRERVIERAVAAGLPFAVWWRQTPAADAFATFSASVTTADARAWPDQVLAFRRAQHGPAMAHPAVTLLWDNPECLPPDCEHPMAPPAQSFSHE